MSIFWSTLATLLLVSSLEASQILYLNVKTIGNWPLTSLLVQLQSETVNPRCYVLTNPVEVYSMVKNLDKNSTLLRVSDEEFEQLSVNCQSKYGYGGVFDMIWPKTKWCGIDDIAESYDDLGEERETDMCCRDHDHCDILKPGESIHDLENNSPYNRLPCHCDRTFANCLWNVKRETSNSLGAFFFNYVQNMCYEFDHPIIECSNRPRRGNCDEYKLDTTKPKIWQFFEPKGFTQNLSKV